MPDNAIDITFIPRQASVDAIQYLMKRARRHFNEHRFVIDNGPLSEMTKLHEPINHLDLGIYTLELAIYDALAEGVVKEPVQRLNAVMLACFPDMTEPLAETDDDGIRVYLWNLVASLMRHHDPAIQAEEDLRASELKTTRDSGR